MCGMWSCFLTRMPSMLGDPGSDFSDLGVSFCDFGVHFGDLGVHLGDLGVRFGDLGAAIVILGYPGHCIWRILGSTWLHF